MPDILFTFIFVEKFIAAAASLVCHLEKKTFMLKIILGLEEFKTDIGACMIFKEV